MRIPISSTVTASGVEEIILKRLTVLENIIDNGLVPKRVDSVIRPGSLSTTTFYLTQNCGTVRTGLSKLCLYLPWISVRFSFITGMEDIYWWRSQLGKECSSGGGKVPSMYATGQTPCGQSR